MKHEKLFYFLTNIALQFLKLTSCFSNTSILRISVSSSADLKPEVRPAGGPDGGPDCGRAKTQVENRIGNINRIVLLGRRCYHCNR